MIATTELRPPPPTDAGLAIRLDAATVLSIARRAADIARSELEDRPDYMGTQDVAAYLRWTPKRIDNLCSQGRIPFRKDGGRRLFVRQEIDEWVRGLDGPTLQDALALAS